jgi:ADP-heptose:LPS heptosyltransferase
MNILITRHDKIGDFITTLPMFKVLKEQTNHRLFALVSKVNYEFAKELDFIDEVILYRDSVTDLSKNIKESEIDISISAFIDSTLALALFLSGIKTRIAPATKIAQIFFNKRVKQRRSEVKMSEWEYNLELLKEIDSSLVLKFSRPILKVDTQRENLVIFHPGFGGSSDGNLTVDEYLLLAKSIDDRVKVLFTFGPSDGALKEYVFNRSNFEIKDDFSSLMDLTLYLSKARLFVSTSTGPMHLAALTNTPTLSFFGSSRFASDKRWQPLNDKELQSNFMAPFNMDDIQHRLKEIVS